MQLSDYLDTDKLAQYVKDGFVTVRSHNKLPLNIYCYSRRTVYSNKWDDVTTCTRGLIVNNQTMEIVSRPFEKFFAYNTAGIASTWPRSVDDMDANFGPPILTEKINGHLGTLWKCGPHWGIASKGSFHSQHAEWATKWFENHLEGHIGIFPLNHTPVFEIICQDIQAHPIHYDKDELVLLALININTGEELNYDGLKGYAEKNRLRVTNRYGFSLEKALQLDTDTIEGLVATYPIPGTTPFKLKIKFPTYLENRKKFYAALKAKNEAMDKANKMPEYVEVFDKASSIVMLSLVECTTKAETAAYFNKPENHEFASICFSMLEANSEKTKGLIWKYIHDRKK